MPANSNSTLASPVSPATIQAIKKMRYDLVQQAVYMIMAYQDWVAILGPNAEDILTSGMTFTAETMEAIMSVSAPDIIDQQVVWGKDYLTGVGITSDMVLKNMEILAEVIKSNFPEKDYPGLSVWMDTMINKQHQVLEAK